MELERAIHSRYEERVIRMTHFGHQGKTVSNNRAADGSSTGIHDHAFVVGTFEYGHLESGSLLAAGDLKVQAEGAQQALSISEVFCRPF